MLSTMPSTLYTLGDLVLRTTPESGCCFCLFIFKRFYLFIFRERGRKGERERNINVWLPLMHPLLGTWPATQACALTGNPTGDPLVGRLELNQLSHTSQGYYCLFKNINSLSEILRQQSQDLNPCLSDS